MKSQLWAELLDAKLVTGEQEKEFEIGSPWYIKLLMAFSGWLAAIFILGILFTLFSRLYDNSLLSFVLGVGFIGSAYFLLRSNVNEFLEHLAFAFSLAGMALVTIALGNGLTHHETALIWLIIAVIQLPLIFIMPNFVHRVFSSFVSAIGFAAALYLYFKSPTEIAIYSALLMLITVLIWLNEFRFPKQVEKFQAIGYGLAAALIAIKGTNVFVHTGKWRVWLGDLEYSSWLQPWMGELLLSAVTFFVVWKLLRRSKYKVSKLAGLLSLGGALILSLLSIEAQGLVVGFTIVLLGFSASNRVLLGLGIISLLFFISSYYYLLENTLLDKAITLLVVGIGLLIGRWIMFRLLPDSSDNPDKSNVKKDVQV